MMFNIGDIVKCKIFNNLYIVISKEEYLKVVDDWITKYKIDSKYMIFHRNLENGHVAWHYEVSLILFEHAYMTKFNKDLKELLE